MTISFNKIKSSISMFSYFDHTINGILVIFFKCHRFACWTCKKPYPSYLFISWFVNAYFRRSTIRSYRCLVKQCLFSLLLLLVIRQNIKRGLRHLVFSSLFLLYNLWWHFSETIISLPSLLSSISINITKCLFC